MSNALITKKDGTTLVVAIADLSVYAYGVKSGDETTVIPAADVESIALAPEPATGGGGTGNAPKSQPEPTEE